MWTKGRVAAVMHLIRYCSISCNKCRRLSDSVESHHVSTGAPFCQLACLRLSSPLAEESLAMLISSPLLNTLTIPSQQITTLSSSFLSFLPNCFSSSTLIQPVCFFLSFFFPHANFAPCLIDSSLLWCDWLTCIWFCQCWGVWAKQAVHSPLTSQNQSPSRGDRESSTGCRWNSGQITPQPTSIRDYFWDEMCLCLVEEPVN